MRSEKVEKNRPAIAIVLCFCAVALVSVMVVKANIDKVRNNLEGANVAEVVQEKEVGNDSNQDENVVDSLDEGSDSAGNDSSGADQGSEAIPEFIMPVNGEIIIDHSVDELIYWKTLDQYMTHAGIDIEAPEGTSVKTCSGGTVTRIEEDDKFGLVCEVTHGNGLVSLYGNLAADMAVEVGDVVECGDVIGKVGKTSMFEYDLPAHLHFEMMLNGECVDPVDYVG